MDMYEMSRWHPMHPDNICMEDFFQPEDIEMSELLEESSNEKRNKTVIEVETMPIKSKPYSHQIEAYNRACSAMRIFKAGEACG